MKRLISIYLLMITLCVYPFQLCQADYNLASDEFGDTMNLTHDVTHDGPLIAGIVDDMVSGVGSVQKVTKKLVNMNRRAIKTVILGVGGTLLVTTGAPLIGWALILIAAQRILISNAHASDADEFTKTVEDVAWLNRETRRLRRHDIAQRELVRNDTINRQSDIDGSIAGTYSQGSYTGLINNGRIYGTYRNNSGYVGSFQGKVNAALRTSGSWRDESGPDTDFDSGRFNGHFNTDNFDKFLGTVTTNPK